MAAKKESTKLGTISQFTANSITIKLNGEDVIVPLDKQENAFLNMVLASQGRDLIQRTLKKWKDDDATPSPKELRDIAGAMRDVAAFSAEVYASAEPATPAKEKAADKADDDINFEELNKPANGNEQPPQAGGGTSA